jgi:hypothetical protein
VDEVHSVSDSCNSNFADLKTVQSFCEGNHCFEREEALVAFTHGHRVVNGDKYFVIAFARQCASEPNLVVSVVARDKRYHFLHI